MPPLLPTMSPICALLSALLLSPLAAAFATDAPPSASVVVPSPHHATDSPEKLHSIYDGKAANFGHLALPKGTSAWSYAFDEKVLARISDYNALARQDLRFNYFFPYAGSLDFDKEMRKTLLSYDSEKISGEYAKRLPAGSLIMPIVDARADKGEFDGWTDEEYQAAALSVAVAVGTDDHAAGVQIDIEPFSESHLPFYRHLRRELNARRKFTTMFVGPKNEKLMSKIFSSCDVVILSGYDLDRENPGVENYRRLLTKALARVQKVASKTAGKFMVGIPAAASWGEYEYSVDAGGQNRTETGTRQEDYVRAALDVLKDYQENPEFLGIALWQLSRSKDADAPEKATKHTKFPDYIRPNVWQILKEYAAKPADYPNPALSRATTESSASDQGLNDVYTNDGLPFKIRLSMSHEFDSTETRLARTKNETL